MKTQRKQLFGGALVAAGLAVPCVQSVEAGSVDPWNLKIGPTAEVIAGLANFGFGPNPGGNSSSANDGTAPGSVSFSGVGNYGAYESNATFSNTAAWVDASGIIDEFTGCAGAATGAITVDAETKITINAYATANAYVSVKVYDGDYGDYIVSVFGYGESITDLSLTLMPGTEYFIEVVAGVGGPFFDGTSPDDFAYAHVAIPAPGAVALLGVACVAGRRRRRN